jgi:hypothetical protein
MATQRCTKCHAVAEGGLKITKGVPSPSRVVKVSFRQELIEQDRTARHSDRQGPSSPRSAARCSLTLG